MRKCAKRAAVANMATKAPAAALGCGGRSMGGLGGTAGTPRGALCSAVEIAPTLTRHMVVPQCSVGHVHPAAGETGERCSRGYCLAKRPDIIAAPSTAPRDIYSVLTARAPLPAAIKRRRLAAKPRRAAGTWEQACQERSSPRVTAALLVRRRQAHRGSGASFPFATTEHVPRQQFDAHQTGNIAPNVPAGPRGTTRSHASFVSTVKIFSARKPSQRTC
jgi:hypothetical protein